MEGGSGGEGVRAMGDGDGGRRAARRWAGRSQHAHARTSVLHRNGRRRGGAADWCGRPRGAPRLADTRHQSQCVTSSRARHESCAVARASGSRIIAARVSSSKCPTLVRRRSKRGGGAFLRRFSPFSEGMVVFLL
ncbi:hypothetical protein FGB62_98g061 [Gracilaria domingensis]|nr:hypothetical protein FGB62_98g061 [Gracilaria domingensis]